MSFSISALQMPNGARLGICPMPGRFRDVLVDCATISKWAPDIVVSMTEIPEMSRHNAEDLGNILNQAGIGWAHYPIGDYGAPEQTSDWPVLSKKLHEILDAKGTVLAHCYGGRGRAGMVLLRLMIERGEQPNAALDRLRDIRAGAVETDAQFAWAAGGASTQQQ